jgi:2-aminoadipate transaminase
VAPARRVGWLVGPPALTAGVELLKQSTDLCGSALTQSIAAELLADEAWFAGHLCTVRTANRARAAALTGAVDEVFGDRVARSTPTGGMFCWLDFTDGTDTTALLPRALEHGVGFVPGSAFGVAEDQAHAARCCFASYPEPLLVEAVRRLGEAWRRPGRATRSGCEQGT